MAADAAAQDQDFTKLSLDERIDHKNWKARQLAYEELAKTFEANTSKTSKDFQRYGSYLKKALAESNILALEKGLDATFAFVKNGEDVAGKYASEIVSVAISKGFGATKPTIKAKITELILMYVELEKQKEVVEEIITGLSNKSPKVLIGCISTLREAVRLFGPKNVGVKPAMKKIAALLEERDKSVREETKLFCVELCRWLGAEVLKPQLEGLKPIQVADLETEFEKVKDEPRPKPERLTRSAQLAAAAAAAEAAETEANPEVAGGDAGADTAVVEEDAVEVDVSEYFEPIDILAKLSADFYTKLEPKKWQERKESLDELEKLLTDAKKLRADADYNELVRVLKKLVQKDSNVNIVSASASCMAKLAVLLKSQFGVGQAKDCLATCFEKFKEKKTNVVTALREAVDALFLCLPGIDALAEELLPALNHKTPTVRIETLLFMARAFTRTRPDQMPKPFMKQMAPVLVENTNNADPAVRDAAAEAIGTGQKVIGENAMKPLLGDTVSTIMQDKIKEACEKAVILVKPKKAPPTAAAPATAGKSGAPAAVKKPGVAAKKDEAGAKKVVKGGGGKAAAAPRPASPVGSLDDDAGSEASEKAVKPNTRAASSTRPPAGGKTASKSRASMAVAATPSKSKKDSDAGPPSSTLAVPSDPKLSKKRRLNDEKTMKTLKWNFETPKAEFVELLREQLKSVAAPSLMPLLFSDDFKHHLKAIEALNEALETCPEASLDASDLILKWFSLRFFETNPAVLVKGLEYLAKLMQRLGTEHGYTLNDLEAHAFFPYLMLKAGESKDGIRAQVRQVIDNCACGFPPVYAPQKLFAFILDGLKSKNARQRAECLAMLGTYIERYGLAICEPNPAVTSSSSFKATSSPAVISTLKAVAAQISDRDATVRNASMNCLLEAHAYVQDDMYKMIGRMADKEKSLLVERVKRNAKAPADRPPLLLNNAPANAASVSPSNNNLLASSSSDTVTHDSKNSAATNNAAYSSSVPKSQSMGNFRRNNRYSTIVLNKQGKSVSGDMSGMAGQQHDIDIDGNGDNDNDADDDAGSTNQTVMIYSPSGSSSISSPPTQLLSPMRNGNHQAGGDAEFDDEAGAHTPRHGISSGATITKSSRLTSTVIKPPPTFAPSNAATIVRHSTRPAQYAPQLKLSQADPASLVYALEDVVMPEVSNTDALTRALNNNDQGFFAAKRRVAQNNPSTSSGNNVWKELLHSRTQKISTQRIVPSSVASVPPLPPQPPQHLLSELDGILASVLSNAQSSSFEECSQGLKLLGDFVARAEQNGDDLQQPQQQYRLCVEQRQLAVGRCLRRLVVKHYVVALNAAASPAQAAANGEPAASVSPSNLLPASQAATLHKVYARVLSIFLSLVSSTSVDKQSSQPAVATNSSDDDDSETLSNDAVESQYSVQVRFYADCLHCLSALLGVERVVKQLLPQGDALHLNANKLVLKIVGQASAPVLIVALMIVMRRVAPGSKQSPSVIHMAQKCIWRLIKRFALPVAAAAAGADQSATTSTPADVWHTSWTYAVLKTSNDFLTSYPPAYWSDFPLAEANPMRTVKHIMTTIGKCEGAVEFQQRHLSRFPSDSALSLFAQPLVSKFPQKGELAVNDDNDSSAANRDLLLTSTETAVAPSAAMQNGDASPLADAAGDDFSTAPVNYSIEYRDFLDKLVSRAEQKADDGDNTAVNGFSNTGNGDSAASDARIELAENFVRALLSKTTSASDFGSRLSAAASTTTTGSNDADDDPHLSRLLRNAQQAILFSRQRGGSKQQSERLSGGGTGSNCSPSTGGGAKKSAVGSNNTESDLEEDFVAVRIGLGAQTAAAAAAPASAALQQMNGVAGGAGGPYHHHQPRVIMRNMKARSVNNNNINQQ